MGGRYYVTGVQLGILKATMENELAGSERLIKLVDKIINEQYIGDASDLRRMMKRANASN